MCHGQGNVVRGAREGPCETKQLSACMHAVTVGAVSILLIILKTSMDAPPATGAKNFSPMCGPTLSL